MKVGKLTGMKVITDDAYLLGEVEGTQADVNTWQITHLDVELTKDATRELGFKKPILGAITVSLPVTVVKKVGDVVALNEPLIEIKKHKEVIAE
ncbi:MAG: hypothetical protein QXU99_05385 [Candidatus Bathyarchaeia archaeon]